MKILSIIAHLLLPLIFFFFTSTVTLVVGHGIITIPRQRGALRVENRLVGDIDLRAPFDFTAHFPAGNKDTVPGSGKESVIRAAGNHWMPYDPLHIHFKWRAGVCGDELGAKQEHLKGGQFYYPPSDAMRVKTYNQGDIIDIEANVVSHHNGYFEFYICNLDTCQGEDISVDCFKGGHCEQLLRAPSDCDSGTRYDCGPIDSAFKGRWYLPCGLFPKGQILYGGAGKGTMKYQLPKQLHCDHCVLQWYWPGANTCNPPGVLNYFQGPDAPNWPPCQGQGGAIGGYSAVQRECMGDRFPEEYWQCSDIRILPSSSNLSRHGQTLSQRVEDSEANRIAADSDQDAQMSAAPMTSDFSHIRSSSSLGKAEHGGQWPVAGLKVLGAAEDSGKKRENANETLTEHVTTTEDKEHIGGENEIQTPDGNPIDPTQTPTPTNSFVNGAHLINALQNDLSSQ